MIKLAPINSNNAMNSKTCQLTRRSHQRPPSPMLEATTPAAPKDHSASHISMISINAHATLITSGRLHTNFTAFCSTNMVNGSLQQNNIVKKKHLIGHRRKFQILDSEKEMHQVL